MDGFLLIHKPEGMTSHDVVYKVKRKLKLDKIGHTGTLDPFASGLLILCIGKATKLQSLFLNLDKTYTGKITFGKHYDTYDLTGQILKETDQMISEDDIKIEMKNMMGSYEQEPPMYSALKKDGRKLYDLAREGIEIDRKKRLVHVYDFYPTSTYYESSIHFYASVSKGTYIRSLAVDLASKLQTYAYLSSLKREKIGQYDVSFASHIEDVTEHDIISLETHFKDYPSITLSDYLIKLVKNGVYLDERQIKIDQPFIVKDQQGSMIAYYEVVKEHTYKPVLIF